MATTPNPSPTDVTAQLHPYAPGGADDVVVDDVTRNGGASGGFDIDQLDLHTATAPRPMKRSRINRWTAALALLLVAGLAFVGGVLAEKSKVGSTSAATSSNLAAAFRSRAASSAGGAATSGAAGASTGQVTLVDGSNIYITLSDGSILKVLTSPAARFQKIATASISDVHPGDTLIVQGQAGDSGTLTATSITDAGAGGTSGFGGRRGGGGSAGGGGGGGAGGATPGG